MPPVRNDPTKALGAVVQHPMVRLVFGIVTAALGAVVLFWPGHPVPVVSVLLGLQLIVSAVFRFMSALGTEEAQQWARVANMIAGVIALIGGVFFLRHPYSLATGAELLGAVLGIYWIVTGVIDVFVVVSQPRQPRRGMTVLVAALSMVVGIILLADPAASMTVIAWLLGSFLVALGVITIVQALLLRQRRARSVQGSPAG